MLELAGAAWPASMQIIDTRKQTCMLGMCRFLEMWASGDLVFWPSRRPCLWTLWTKNWHTNYSCRGKRTHQFWFFYALLFLC